SRKRRKRTSARRGNCVEALSRLMPAAWHQRLLACSLVTRFLLRRAVLYLVRDPWPWGKPHDAAGIHRTSSERGKPLAARRARPTRTAARAQRAHGRAYERRRGRSGCAGPTPRVRAGAAGTRLDSRNEIRAATAATAGPIEGPTKGVGGLPLNVPLTIPE